MTETLLPMHRRGKTLLTDGTRSTCQIERLHLYGGHFTLFTDCKPIQLILDNPKSRPPARIEHWNLRLQGYKFRNCTHQRKIQSLWFPVTSFRHKHRWKARCASWGLRQLPYISCGTESNDLSRDTASNVGRHDMQSLADMIHKGKFEKASRGELAQFRKVKDELTANKEGNVILRDSWIVMPTALRERESSSTWLMKAIKGP